MSDNPYESPASQPDENSYRHPIIWGLSAVILLAAVVAFQGYRTRQLAREAAMKAAIKAAKTAEQQAARKAEQRNYSHRD